jgi:PAS domain S-box-containing protein
MNETSLFANILDIAGEAIISIDEAQRIRLFNQEATKIFGYSPDEVLGQPLDILLPKRFIGPHRQHIAEFAHSGVTARLMAERQGIVGRRKNGEEFPAEASISKLEGEGERLFTVILRDITERKRAEAEREKLITELTILEERERFARDLHDSIIQSIYAAGLSLDNLKADIPLTDETLRAQIELSLKSLANVITDIRNYIFDLRPQAVRDKGLKVRLEGLVRELQVNTPLLIQAEISPEINACLNEVQASHVFHICHEALANVARHAKARQVQLSLTRKEEMVIVRVEDDGIGFELPSEINPGHHGLANIQTRVAQLAAHLDLESVPRQGTRLTVTFKGEPSPSKSQASPGENSR